jgi:hypothetical protein
MCVKFAMNEARVRMGQHLSYFIFHLTGLQNDTLFPTPRVPTVFSVSLSRIIQVPLASSIFLS